jgi:hypothetical protein
MNTIFRQLVLASLGSPCEVILAIGAVMASLLHTASAHAQCDSNLYDPAGAFLTVCGGTQAQAIRNVSMSLRQCHVEFSEASFLQWAFPPLPRGPAPGPPGFFQA